MDLSFLGDQQQLAMLLEVVLAFVMEVAYHPCFFDLIKFGSRLSNPQQHQHQLKELQLIEEYIYDCHTCVWVDDVVTHSEQDFDRLLVVQKGHLMS